MALPHTAKQVAPGVRTGRLDAPFQHCFLLPSWWSTSCPYLKATFSTHRWGMVCAKRSSPWRCRLQLYIYYYGGTAWGLLGLRCMCIWLIPLQILHSSRPPWKCTNDPPGAHHLCSSQYRVYNMHIRAGKWKYSYITYKQYFKSTARSCMVVQLKHWYDMCGMGKLYGLMVGVQDIIRWRNAGTCTVWGRLIVCLLKESNLILTAFLSLVGDQIKLLFHIFLEDVITNLNKTFA